MTDKNESIADALTSIAERADGALLDLDEAEIAAQWFWRWEDDKSAEWNIYTFSNELERYKRRCRRWEDRKNGSCCVVERVRDKYVMPRVRELLTATNGIRNALLHDQEPLGAEFEAVWDANTGELYES